MVTHYNASTFARVNTIDSPQRFFQILSDTFVIYLMNNLHLDTNIPSLNKFKEGMFSGSGERIRTTDLRVMSPTSYHCSTPRCGWRTDLVSQRASRQYLQRWNVSRPGSGWDGVGPLRFLHANGSGWIIIIEQTNRDLVVHVPDLPSGKPSAMRTSRLHVSPHFQLWPLSQ